MSTQPVWIVNGGATTVTSPPRYPIGSTLPVWVVNATDSVSKLKVPTTVDITSSSNSAPVINFVNSGTSNDSISITSSNNTNSSKKIVVNALGSNMRYTVLSNKEHSLSFPNSASWTSAPKFYLGGFTAPLYSEKSYKLESTYSMYMPIGQNGFGSKTYAAGVYIPNSCMFRLRIETFTRITSGVTYARNTLNGYCDPSSNVYSQTGIDNDFNLPNGVGYFVNSTTNSLNVLNLDYIGPVYSSPKSAEYVWGYFQLSILQFVA